jgi:hypothetical protein
VKPIALDTIVLWDQITLDSPSIYLPLLWSYKHFLIPEKVIPFTLSTTPLNYRWYTEENFTWVPRVLQYSLKE